MNNKQKHHYVQEKYIAQWHNPANGNQLSVFNHDTREINRSGAKAKSFWEKDYNIFSSSKEDYYLPEKVTSYIDDKGIRVIRKINELKQEPLDNIERSTIATYTALQYLRTPRHRKETDEFFNAGLGNQLRKYVKEEGNIKMTRELLKKKPNNKEEEKLLKYVEQMTEEEFQSHISNEENLAKMEIIVDTEGHSKLMLNHVTELGKDIHDFQWTLFIAFKGTSFVTSDNPCFTVSGDPKRSFSGLCSDYAVTIFPLSPEVLLYINNSRKSHTEQFCVAPKSIVRCLNKMVVANSYDCVVAKDKVHLASLLKNYRHKKVKEGKVKEAGDYSFITLE